jgi:uroporphyrin-III C-methyltransferase / precorrin-2 dehydrogenase / sirohydrochlorin ferrochelatase
VFGRGGEKRETLRAAGVAVPGVTAACTPAAWLGIPAPYRGVARSMHCVGAHGRDDSLPVQDFTILAASGGSMAAHMAARTSPDLAARPIAAGLPAGTPAVAVENASRPGTRHVFACLPDLAAWLAVQDFAGPTLILIGAVVGRRYGEPAQLPA